MTGIAPAPLDPRVQEIAGRLKQIVLAGVQRYLDKGRKPQEAVGNALEEMSLVYGSQNWPGVRDALHEYAMGRAEQFPDLEQLPTVRVPALGESPEDYAPDGGVLGTMRHSVLDPVAQVGWSFLQAGADLGIGAANLLGATIEPLDLKTNARALASKAFGTSGGKTLSDLLREEEAQAHAIEGGRGAGGRIAMFGGEAVGEVAALFGTGGATLAGKGAVGAAAKLGMRAASKVNAAGVVMRAGGAVGNRMVDAIARHILKKAPGSFAKRAARVGGGLGLYSGLAAQGSYDAEGNFQPPDGWERLGAAALGAATGVALEGLGQLGRAWADRILKGGAKGRWERAGVNALKDWATQNRRTPMSWERPDEYMLRVAEEWAATGYRGLTMPLRRVMATAAQTGTETVGFSFLDQHMWGDTWDAIVRGDDEAALRAIERLAGTALGLAAIHAGGKIHDIPAWQRRQPPPFEYHVGTPRDIGMAQEPAPPGAPRIPRRAEAFQEKSGKEFADQLAEADLTGRAPAADATQLAQGYDARRVARAEDPGAQRRLEAQRKLDDAARGKNLTDWPQTGRLSSGLRRLGWRQMPQEPDAGPDVPVQTPPPEPVPVPAELEPVSGGVQPRQIRIPNTPYLYAIHGETVRPARKLREALGLPEYLGRAEFERGLERAGLISALQAKAVLDGVEIDAAGVYAYPPADAETAPMERTMLFGEVYERPLGQEGRWKLVTEATMPRQPDEIGQEQMAVVRGLLELREARPDLFPEYQAVLDAAVTAMLARSAAKDEAVSDTLGFLAAAPLPAEAPREALGEAILNVARSLTTTHPDAILSGLEPSVAPQEPQAAAQEPAPQEAAEDPPSGAQPQYGGLVPPQVGEAAKASAKFGVGVAKEAVGMLTQLYSESQPARLQRELERAGEVEHMPIVDKAWRAITSAKGIRGELGKTLNEAQEAVRAPRRELEERIDWPSGQAWVSRWHAAMDTDAGVYVGFDPATLSPEAQKAVELGRKLTKDIRRMAHERGVEVEIAGERVQVAETRDKDVMVRRGTPELRQIIEMGSGPSWDVLTRELAAANEGMTLAEVQDTLTEAPRPLKRRDPIEMMRKFPNFPSGIRVGGRDVQLLEDSAHRQLTGMVDFASMRLGVIEHFGQDLPAEGETAYEPEGAGPLPYRQIVAGIRDRPARVAAEALMRSLHGIPLSRSFGVDPTTTLGRFARGTQIYMSTWAAMKMSQAFTANILEPWGAPAAQLGASRILHGHQRILTALLNSLAGKPDGIMSLVREAAAKGYFRRDLPDWSTPGTGMEKARSVGRAFNHGVLYLFEVFQRGAELIVGFGAERAVENMRAGRGTKGDVAFAQRFGFSRERAEELAAGRGEPADYDRILRNTVSTLAGGGSQLPAERSRAALDRTFPNLVRFTGFFQKQMGSLRSHLDDIGRARNAGERSDAGLRLLKFLFFNMATGVAIDSVRALLGGTDNVARYWRELVNDPLYGGSWALASALFGGPGAVLVSVLRDAGKEFEARLGSAFMHTIAPLAAAAEAIEFGAALSGATMPHSRYNETSFAEKVGIFGETTMPLLRRFSDGIFGLDLLSVRDPAVPRARSAHYRWMLRHTGMKFAGSSGDPEFLSAMRNVAHEVAVGTAWSEDEVRESLRQALRLKGGRAVAASLAARRLITGNSDYAKLTEEQRQAHREFLGEDDFLLLLRYDDSLARMAEVMGKLP